ncbi:MAG: B12-binding domain-containing radical SAM protein [Chloroflexi bacterium]|nr:B12-binding domain-containing radical SAM protein [Chloroflexota bacterium]
MKTWVCTTLANFFGPMQGAARLYAYLKKQGHDVSLKDFNQDAYFALLSRANLERILDNMKYILEPVARSRPLRESLGSLLLRGSNDAIRQALARSLLGQTPLRPLSAAPDILRRPILSLIESKLTPDNILYALLSEKESVLCEIERARQTLDEGWYSLSPQDFLRHYLALLCGKAIIDTAYFPAQLDFGFGIHGTEYNPRVSDILHATEDERHNYLLPYFRDEVLPQLRQERPEIVGISVTHTNDFIPAFTLASLIKKEDPAVHVTLGGSTLTEVAFRLAENPALWVFFDSLVLGPGERAFSALIEELPKGGDLSRAPNVIYKQGGEIRRSERTEEFDLNEACTPEFVGVRPQSGLPLEASSGCYWGKCIFCYYPKLGTAGISAEHGSSRVRDIELVIKDMQTLKAKYDPLYVGFTDSSLSPRRLEQIAEHNLAGKDPVKFSAFVRFEKQFESPSLCRKLAAGGFLGGQIGLESGSQRVNEIINKGVGLKSAEAILKNMREAGILIHLYTLIGTPGETAAESKMTRDFIKRRRRELTLGWQIYPLWVLEHGPLAERAGEFGLTIKPLADDILAQITEYEVREGLSQAESTSEAIRHNESLKRYLHPLNRIMDIESHKLFLLAQHAKGIGLEEVARVCRR